MVCLRHKPCRARKVDREVDRTLRLLGVMLVAGIACMTSGMTRMSLARHNEKLSMRSHDERPHKILVCFTSKKAI